MRGALVCLWLLAAVPAAAQDRFMAPLPADADLAITRDIDYATVNGRALKFDLYKPRASAGTAPVPVVIFFNGIGADWMRSHVQYTSWPRYVTTAGLGGISMDSTEASAPEDFDRLVAHLRANASILGIDPERIVVWACSANVTRGLPLTQDTKRPFIVAAVMYYGQGEVTAFRLDVPLLLVRAGTDHAGLNRGMGRIAEAALAANVPLTVMNHPFGKHGFDLRNDDGVTREILSRTLAFMKDAVEPRRIAALRAGVPRAAAAAALFREDWPAAVKAYEALATETPGDPEPQQRLGEALMGQGEYARAVPAFERSLRLNTPNRGAVLLSLVRADVKLGELDRAFSRLEEAKPFLRFFTDQLRADPDFAPLRSDPRFYKIAGM